ncbi:MAG: Glucokinase [Myxococcaceae bacterium]|jgi:glucokinase|nr:Glucokinase [Myxococcaceae bacterium]MEA2752141.1 glucokinase [Myxococcales bacterium]
MSPILAGDIGGTRARFALLEPTGRKVLYQDVLESRSFPTFEAALDRFIEGANAKGKGNGKKAIRAASFGIAGPVVDQRVKTTNLPWVIDAGVVSSDFRIERVTLLNDLVAVGLGAIAAGPSKLRGIHAGKPRKTGGNLAVIAAGTGLGEASFVWDGTAHVACPTEGAHVDFAPRNPVEIELWNVLAREYGHVSYERVASGSTIAVLYTFFVRDQRVPESKSSASYVARAKDPNVAVVDLAETGKSEAAMRAVELWCSVYGAEAGNLALKSLATAGVYICGGASARLAGVLAAGLPARRKRSSPFLEAFVDKGRMRPLLEKIPIAVCTEPFAGLFGAAAHAAKRAAARPQRKSRQKPLK